MPKQMRTQYLLPILVFATALLSGLTSCKHDPTFEVEGPVNPGDTTGNPVDTMHTDTTGQGVACDPETVYFDQQVLPILQSNCARSGCHDATSAQDGVELTSYERVMATADVRPFDLSGSDLYEVITDSDPDDRMPPPPNNPLTAEQVNLVRTWILQGAQNLACDPGTGGECDTENISFAADVRPVLTNFCLGCHSGGAPSGGVNLNSHDGVAAVAASGQLYGAISHQPGFVAMPQGGARLDSCTIDKIKSWIDAGAPNN